MEKDQNYQIYSKFFIDDELIEIDDKFDYEYPIRSFKVSDQINYLQTKKSINWDEWQHFLSGFLNKNYEKSTLEKIFKYSNEYLKEDFNKVLFSILENKYSEEDVINIKKSFLNLLKHYPVFKNENTLFWLDENLNEFYVKISKKRHQTDYTDYIMLRFKGDGNIYFFLGDTDDGDDSFYFSGSGHTSFKIKKSYKIDRLLSFLKGY